MHQLRGNAIVPMLLAIDANGTWVSLTKTDLQLSQTQQYQCTWPGLYLKQPSPHKDGCWTPAKSGRALPQSGRRERGMEWGRTGWNEEDGVGRRVDFAQEGPGSVAAASL